MPFDDLRQWIAALDRAGQLKRIQTEVDPILEVAEITDRVSKMHMPGQPPSGVQPGEARQPGGPALLFQNINRHPGSQLLINQFGSEARMKLAVGVNSYDEIASRIRMFMDVKSPQGFLDKLKMLPLLTEAGKFFPRTVTSGPCKEVIKRDNFSLLGLPNPPVLAQRCGTIHHATVRRHTRSAFGKAERGHVPNAGVRRAHHWHALAAPESCSGTRARTHARRG